MKDKNPLLDIARGMAILLVLSGHLIQRSMVVSGQDYFFHPVFQFIYIFHMPLFFFISGYLMALSLKHRNIRDVLKSRAQGLLVPFISWGLLGLLIVFGLYRVDAGGQPFLDFLRNPLYMPIWFIWFLLTLFVCGCLLMLSAWLQRRMGKISFALVFLLLLMWPWPDIFCLYYVKWFYLFFLAGYAVSCVGTEWMRPLMRGYVFLTVTVIFMVMMVFWTKNDFIYINQMHINWLDRGDVLRLCYRYLAGFLGIVFMFFVARYVSMTPWAKALSMLGVYSLDIYLIQRYVLEGFYPKMLLRLPVMLDANSFLFISFWLPVLTLAFAAICFMLSHAVVRKNVWLNRLFLGGRG